MNPINPPVALILQTDYHTVISALISENKILETKIDSKVTASSHLIISLSTLLNNHALSWENLDYIGVNQGPGPFTTLRVIISTVNGLAFAQNIPLVGIDGLELFLLETHPITTPVTTTNHITVVVLNAFAQDVYFGIKQDTKIISMGWDNIDNFLTKLQNVYPEEQITFVGNGTELFKEKIMVLFTHRACFLSPLPQFASLQALANRAYTQWQEQTNIQKLLEPLYLKTITYKSSYQAQ